MTDELIVFLIIAIRLVLPLLIPIFPLPTILSLLVLDAADQSILQKTTDLSLDDYQGYDKALDIWYLAMAYLATIRTWTDDPAQHVGAFLWYYRLVGVVAFELLGYRWLLMVFPNTFEYFFIAYEAIRLKWDPRRLSRRGLIGLAAFIWIVIKLPQEWWIHVAQLDFTDFMKEDVFGVPVATPWGEAIAENLWFVGLLAMVVVGAALVWRSQRAKVPTPDWPTTVRVADHLEPVPSDTQGARDGILSLPTGEKVALIGLICVIFASVLPDIDRGPLQTAVGVGLLIVANATVSHWLTGRGVRWRSTGTQLLTMLVVNASLLWLFGTLGRASREDLNAGALVFFTLVISLLVTLYDRFEAEREARLADGRTSSGEGRSPVETTGIGLTTPSSARGTRHPR
ncbi:MAG TPA: hypothetical protein VIT01_09660 [Acidimicrobiales bacterium]